MPKMLAKPPSPSPEPRPGPGPDSTGVPPKLLWGDGHWTAPVAVSTLNRIWGCAASSWSTWLYREVRNAE